jgi:hypothetical protein
MTGITMGNVYGIAIVDITFDAASVAANTSAEQDITVPGVRVGDHVACNAQSITAGLSLGGARAKAADTVSVTFTNSTASPIDAPSKVYRFIIHRPEVVGATSFGF